MEESGIVLRVGPPGALFLSCAAGRSAIIPHFSFLIPNLYFASSLFQTFFWEVKPCLM